MPVFEQQNWLLDFNWPWRKCRYLIQVQVFSCLCAPVSEAPILYLQLLVNFHTLEKSHLILSRHVFSGGVFWNNLLSFSIDHKHMVSFSMTSRWPVLNFFYAKLSHLHLVSILQSLPPFFPIARFPSLSSSLIPVLCSCVQTGEHLVWVSSMALIWSYIPMVQTSDLNLGV